LVNPIDFFRYPAKLYTVTNLNSIFGGKMNQDYSSALGIFGGLFGTCCWLIGLLLGIFVLVALWKVYQKAGKPGWAAIVPIYNILVLLEIVGKPWWWLLLMLIPFVNIVIMILVYLELAKVFGKGAGFGVGLILLPYIFVAILGFGDAQYTAPVAPAV
jgi:phosphoglycerol transferase MdoB-like AlkP superfamily enzyme